MATATSASRCELTEPASAPVALSVVIPTFNKCEALERHLTAISQYLDARRWDYEILVVDDGSRDGSEVILDRLRTSVPRLTILHGEHNRGKGWAVRRGVLAASKAYVLYTDADGAVPIAEVEKLMDQLVSGCDIAFGSRCVPGAQVLGRPFCRRVASRVLNGLVQNFLFTGIRDTQCGFKCWRRAVVQHLFRVQRLDGFSFEIEVLALALRRGYRLREVPVKYVHGSDSTIRLVRDSFAMLTDMFGLMKRFGSLSPGAADAKGDESRLTVTDEHFRITPSIPDAVSPARPRLAPHYAAGARGSSADHA